ncbi:acyltransferase family protein [Serratia sarumanii]|uniref:acyltransferase family protein n=1 Tax=Serratia sarumanii TaxID=3020826 RepID=UPI003F7DF448
MSYTPQGKIYSIQYLRGIAALLVLFFHLRFDLNNLYIQKDIGDILFGNGAFGVDLFFVISGFVIMYATEKKETMQGIKYVIRRFFRIYPMLVSCIVFYFLFIYTSDNYNLFFRSLIPLNSNYSAGSPFFGYNLLMPAWTLTYEIAFYALFLMSLSISHKYRGFICFLLIILCVCLIQKTMNGTITFNAHNSFSFSPESIFHAPLTLLASPMFLDFAYGLLIFFIIKNYGSLIVRYRAEFIITSNMVILICLYLLMTNKIYGHGPTALGFLGAAIVLSLLTIEKAGALPYSKALSFLGDISYSIYLTQAVIFEFIDRYSIQLPFGVTSGIPRFLMLTIIVIGISYVTYRLIELPFVRLGKTIIKHIERISEKRYVL